MELSSNPGLPKEMKGRMGIAVSPAQPERVWATIEATNGGSGVYRSDDAGEAWQRVNDDPNLQLRHWYYEHIFADPLDPDSLYSLNVQAWKSIDGGRTFTGKKRPQHPAHNLDSKSPLMARPGDPTSGFDSPFDSHGNEQKKTSGPSGPEVLLYRSLSAVLTMRESFRGGGGGGAHRGIRGSSPPKAMASTRGHSGEAIA